MVVFFVSAGSHARGSGAFAWQDCGRSFSACVVPLTVAVHAVTNAQRSKPTAFMYDQVGSAREKVTDIFNPTKSRASWRAAHDRRRAIAQHAGHSMTTLLIGSTASPAG